MDISNRYQDLQDSYIFCPQCCIYVFEYCAIHGPPLIIPDTEVSKSPLPHTLPQAALTIPHAFLHVALSSIPGAGLGVFSSRTIPPNVRFGPYRGRRTLAVTSTYCWQVFLNNEPAYVIDASDENSSNWMRYINCSRHFKEQNLVAYQHRGQIFYRTIKPIEPFTELLVFYGSEFAKILGIDLRKYNRDEFYLEITQAHDENKQEYFQNKKCDSLEKRLEDDVFNKAEINYYNNPSTKNCADSIENENEKRNVKNCHIQGTSKDNNKTNCISDNTSESNFKENRRESLIKYLTCDICDETFNYATDMTNHILNHTENSVNGKKEKKHIKNSPLPCNYYSQYATLDKSILDQHVTENQEQKQCYKCRYCGFITYYKQNLNKHVNIKHEKKQSYKCSFCEFITYNEQYLKTHVNAKHEIKQTYKCSFCEYITYYNEHLKKHVNAKHEKKQSYKCSFCEFITYNEQYLKTHVNAKHNKKRSYKCSFCEFITYNEQYLKTHVNAKHEKKQTYKCSFCGYITYYNESLKKHVNAKHEKKLSYKCSFCEYVTCYKELLKTHVNAKHNKKRSYKCSFCEFVTYYEQYLKRHVNAKHNKKRSYKCTFCKYITYNKINLNAHVNAKHEKKQSYKCSFCEYVTYYKQHLEKHVNAKHEKKQTYKCSLCEFITYYKDNLSKHIKQSHKKP